MENKVLQEALGWVGYLEKKSNAQLEDYTANAGSNNYTIFAKWYKEYWGDNYQAQPWCAVFVSVVFWRALGVELFPHFAYCPTAVNNFKQAGQWVTSSPQAGDVIFFKDGTDLACHVAIVTSADAKYVYTVEGNTSSAAGVVANGGSVAQKSYALGYNMILGYGRPAYVEVPIEVPGPSAEDCTAELQWRGVILKPELWNERAAEDEDIKWLLIKYYPYMIKNGGSVKSPLSVGTAEEAVATLQKCGIVSNADLWIEKAQADEDVKWLLVKMADYVN